MALIQVWKQIWQVVDTTVFFNPSLVPVILFSLLFLFKLTRGGRTSSPPSPPRLPIIGNLHQLGKVPHRSINALAEKYGPLMLLHFGSVPTLVVSSTELAKEVFRTHETIFTNRPRNKAAGVFFLGCNDILFGEYSDHWRQAKKLSVVELLNLRRVQSFQFVREEEVAELVKKIRPSCPDGSSVDFCKMMVTISNNIVCRSVLGKKYEGDNDNEITFGEILRRALDLIATFCFEDLIPYLAWMDTITGLNARVKETSRTLHTFLDQVIDEHQIPKSDNLQNDKKDFVDILLHLQSNGLLDIELTRDSLKSILLDMLVAGTDTSAASMEWTMAELVKNPTIMKKAQEEVRNVVGKKSKVEEADVNQMKYLKCVVKETLRLHASFFIVRESTSSVTLAGYDFPPKQRLFINLWGIQRDPNLWDRPEEFLPERFANDPVDFKGQDLRFFPFGSGRRVCPGITYAVMEMEYVIANLLYWFDWKLPDGASAEDLDMVECFQQVNRKKIPLSLVPILHTH